MLLESIKLNLPQNESAEHYELKQIAKYILFSKGYKIIGTEVHMGRWSQYLKKYKQFNPKATQKSIIDVIGVKTKCICNQNLPTIQCMGIESKVSISDFKNGFCCLAEHTYIIAPKDVIPVDMLPEKIGLIEVDLKNYTISNYYGKLEFTGIETVKKPISRLDDVFVNKENSNKKPKDSQRYQTWCLERMRSVGYRNTVADIFSKNEINIK